jgi:L-2-hydroxyglutarate oxidase LhgO
MTRDADVVVVGGGIVGLATAFQLLLRRPGLRLVLLEKETALATHQTGRNSGVVHSPTTYAPGSLKARLCLEGQRAAFAFADAHGVPYRICGELIVATDASELPRLAAIQERATANGIEGLRPVGPDEMREIEPHVRGIRGLHVPTTAVMDWRRLALALCDEIRARGGEVRTSATVTAIHVGADETVVESTVGPVVTRHVITCAGLWADRVAAMTDRDRAVRIVPFRGDYYTLRPAARHLCRALIYPVPDPRFPFLGVHLTRMIDGEVRAGPNAVLAFAREGYRRSDIDLREMASILRFAGFRRLARRHLRTGLAEMWRDWSKAAFLAAIQRYVPEVRSADLTFGTAGIRAQALGADGTLVDDFLVTESAHVIHVRNAPSPAATASLAIGRELAERAIRAFAIAGPGPGAGPGRDSVPRFSA